MSDAEEIREIARWFNERGFELRFSREATAIAWVDLARLPVGDIVAPKYGRGQSEVVAARRARQRFVEEQG